MESSWRPAAIALGLIALVAISYAPVHRAGFTNFDDPDYVTANPRVRSGLSAEDAVWAFHPDSIVSGNWHPLTVLSHMVDVELFGLDASAHHWSSVGLHALNAVLVLLVLWGATGSLGRSAVVAGLFAVHPVNVESVAWISERKNLLSTTFWLLTTAAYLRHARRPSSARLSLVALLLTLGLLSKPMLVTLPFALLLLDYWPLGRLSRENARRVVLEKVPLLLISGAFVWTTLRTQSHVGSVSAFTDEPLSMRLANALQSYGLYVRNLFWPRDLTVFYPWSSEGVPTGAWLLSLGVLVVLSTLAVLWRRRRPWVFVGWFWYLGVLVPVIGLVQVGSQTMADRYAYVPYLGLLVALTWTAADRLGRTARPSRAALAGAGLIVLLLVPVTRTQVATWRDSETLFRHALSVTECNYLALNNLGEVLASRGETVDSEGLFRRAVECEPGYPIAQMNLGTVLLQRDELEEARRHLSLAVRVDPDFAEAHANLGATLMKMRRFDEAIVHLEHALRVRPDLQAARANLRRARGYAARPKG